LRVRSDRKGDDDRRRGPDFICCDRD